MKDFKELYVNESVSIDTTSEAFRNATKAWFYQGGHICSKRIDGHPINLQTDRVYHLDDGDLSFLWDGYLYVPVVIDVKKVKFTWATIFQETRESLWKMGVASLNFSQPKRLPITTQGGADLTFEDAAGIGICRQTQVVRLAYDN